MKNDDYYDKLDRSEKRSECNQEAASNGHYVLSNDDFDRLALDFQSDYQDGENDLDFLVRVANEGMRAESLLLTKHFKEIQRRHSNNKDWVNFTHNPYNGYSVYRVKPVPTFAPFYVGKKTCCSYDPITKMGSGHTGPCTTGEYLVELKNDYVHIHNVSFLASKLKDILDSLCNRNFCDEIDGGTTFEARREGPSFHGEWHFQISWYDADRILEALEKAGY